MEELVLQFLNGDNEAFSKLIELIKIDLYRIAKARLHDIDDVNDAIQESIIIAYRTGKSLEKPKYFKTWIIKILINECNKIYKQNKRKINMFEKITKERNKVIDDDMDLLNVENKLDLEEILKKLSYEEQSAIILFYKNNYSLIEISNILNISPNTIKSRIMRAKQKIKKNYKDKKVTNNL